MSRRWVYCLLLGLLGLLTQGCQHLPRDFLPPLGNPSPPAPSPPPPSQTELPPDQAARACLATAEALDKGGKEAEAIVLYEKARQAGHSVQVSRRLAVLYDRKGDFNRAVEEYQLALRASPKDADLLNDLGYCYYTRGKWPDAEKYLRQALALNPKHARAWTNLGLTLSQQQRYAEGLEAFLKVVPEAQAYCNLAFVFMTQGKRDEAKEAYQKALTLEPELRLAEGALAKLEQAPAREQNGAPAPTPPAEVTQRPQAPLPPQQSSTPEAVPLEEPEVRLRGDLPSP